MKGDRAMKKFNQLPLIHQKRALKMAIDEWNELYEENGVNYICNAESPEVIDRLKETNYVIRKNKSGIERLERIY